MEEIFQNWAFALSLGIVGGSLIGLVMGHKLKEPNARAFSSPMIFQSGSTNRTLVGVGFSMVILAFFIGALQGIAAIIVAYIAETIVGTRVTNNNQNTGYFTVLKTIVFLSLIIVLPVLLWGYSSYNRTPNSTDKASFIYDCSNHAANEIFTGDSKGNTSDAKEICKLLWSDMVGRYKIIGRINDNVRDVGDFGLYTDEAVDMYNTCVDETIY